MKRIQWKIDSFCEYGLPIFIMAESRGGREISDSLTLLVGICALFTSILCAAPEVCPDESKLAQSSDLLLMPLVCMMTLNYKRPIQ